MDGEGLTCGLAGAGGAVAAGLVFGPGCVFGGADGGLTAAAGWLCASDLGPATEVGFGVVLAVALAAGVALALAAGDAFAFEAGETAALGAGEVWGAALGDAAAIGPAAVGFLAGSSTSINCIAWLIGIRATPLVLSTQP